MKKLRDWFNRRLSASSQPTSPAPSAFSNEARVDELEREKDFEMQMAIEKERSRKSSF